MTMRFSLGHLTALGCAPPELTHIAAQAGYDFVSPRIIMMGNESAGNYTLAENKPMLQQTKSALAETGLRVHDIELARIYDGVDLNSFAPSFEVAADLSAHHVLCSIWTPNRSYAIECFGELCDLAKSFGLTVNLEFVTWADVKDLQSAVSVLEEANRENVGIMVDMLHFHRSRVQLEELDNVPRHWFNFAHLCDAPGEIPATREGLIKTGREERLYLGEGEIDIAAILSRLPDIPYVIELPNLAREKELGSAEHAKRCLDSAKAYLSANLHTEFQQSRGHARLRSKS